MCVAKCCSVLQCVAVCCSVLQCVAVCCNVLQCVAVCCGVLQCVAVCYIAVCCDAVYVLQCVAVSRKDRLEHMCCSVFQWVAVFCSVLQCVAVCCSVLQHQGNMDSSICVAVWCCSVVLQYKVVCCNVGATNEPIRGYIFCFWSTLTFHRLILTADFSC